MATKTETKKVAHTPGPWTADSPDDGRVSIIAADGDSIGHAEGRNQPDDIANARLIASAPELLAACKAWAAFFERLNRDTEAGDPLRAERNRYHGERIAQTLAAIAKAEGGAS